MKRKNMKNMTTQEKIRKLHETNTQIYDIIDSLNELEVDMNLTFQKLRDATAGIHKSITDLINQSTDNNPNVKGNEERQ